MINIVIHGAAGRMGKRLVALASVDTELQIVGAIEHPSSPMLGQDCGQVAGVGSLGIPVSATWPDDADVAIDFSSPQGAAHALDHCLQASLPLVIATTGLESDLLESIQAATSKIAICHAPNMSMAVNLTMKLVEQAAKSLKHVAGGVDVEILERHHRFKEDSPSGTALQFGKIISQQMTIERHVHGREGQVGKRSASEIGYHAIRAGDDPGQHTILFGMMGELIELRVAASNRDCYASGALQAAKYIVGKPAGLYSMYDVLGLT